MRKVVKIKFQNGINSEIAYRDILSELMEQFVFEENDQPDFILFGPYGDDAPPPGDYVRIGYFCENMQPDMSSCEWAFGIPNEEIINSTRYRKIQWHGIDPSALIKASNYDVESIFKKKKFFCNFLYSHSVPYREKFFRQLSKYKKMNAPGKSMNNMISIDNKFNGNIWERKRAFLSDYKFTLSFENYIYPGYQTEKLYDAMQANSIPVYCGDPFVGAIFNDRSFINCLDFGQPDNSLIKWLEGKSQIDFIDIRPAFFTKPNHRIKRKMKAMGRSLKTYFQLQKVDFTSVIDRIIELDRDDDKYLETLSEPWFNKNKAPSNSSVRDRWIEIFNN